MEISSRPQERENPSPTTSPSSNGQLQNPPQIPRPVSRSESNPYPTTFVQADTSNFKQVVQMLTGSSSDTAKHAPTKPSSADPPNPQSSKAHVPPIQKKQSFKLYERRNQLKNGFVISPLAPQFGGHRSTEILSPSILDFPSLALSPVTPLIEDPFYKSSSSPSVGSSSEEEKAIAEKGFYLHPSPRTTPRGSEPKLLPLFPVTSPRVSGSSSSSS